MASEPKQLSRLAREAIREARERTGVAVATITLWELAWLAEKRSHSDFGRVESFVRETVARVILKPMTPEIAAFAVRLPAAFPKDPADRVITSTAMIEGAPLITADARIRQTKIVETIW